MNGPSALGGGADPKVEGVFEEGHGLFQMLSRRLLHAEADDADGAGVVQVIEDPKESSDIIAAASQGLDELVPAHAAGVAVARAVVPGRQVTPS